MKNNKGMAFVSVMIAILFVGMLTTSLCFMAYSNYQAKATRWSSENNFYYDEWAVDELSSNMRQVAQYNGDISYHADEDTKDRLTEFIKALSTATGVNPADNGNYKSVHGGTWDKDAMQALLQVTNNADFKVEVDYADRGPATYIREKKTIRFKNVKITVTDLRADKSSKDYTTTIVTDIVIPGETTAAGIPVNDFSLMADSPVKWGGGIINMSGNLFCIDDASAPTHTGVAFELDHGTQVSLCGRKSLIVGNVVVKGGSVLYLNNEVTITGNLIVEDSSMVFAYGNSVMAAGTSGTVIGPVKVRPELASNANSVFCGSGEYGNGLANCIIDNVTVINAFDATTNTPTGYLELSDVSHAANGRTSSLGALAQITPGSDIDQTSSAGGSTVYFRAVSDDVSGRENSLIFLPDHGQKLRGSFINTTVIAPVGHANFSADPMQAPDMSKLSAQDYQNCLNTLVQPGAFRNEAQLIGGSKTQFDNAVNAFKTAQANGTADECPYFVKTMPNKANADRYMVYEKATGKSMVPWGYFIREDADQKIGDAFATIRDKIDEDSEYKIVYDNWEKE